MQLPTVLAINEQKLIKIDRCQVFQKLKTMARRRIDQMIRTQNVQARMERIDTSVLVKTPKKVEIQR